MRTSTSASGGTAPLTGGSIWRAIWIMSWPLVLTTLASSLIGLVDIHVAGYLGSSVQAAVGISEQFLFLFMIFIMSVSTGTTAIVSRAIGAEKVEEASFAAGQSLLTGLVGGVLLTAAALFTAKFMLPLFASDRQVVSQGNLYLSIFSLYLIPFSIVNIIGAIFRAIGDAKTPLLIIGVMTSLNIAGDYSLVLFNWPVPGLGIKGIAVAAVAATCVASVIAVFCLMKSRMKESLRSLLPASIVEIKRVLSVGVPSAFQRLSWASSAFVLFFVLSKCNHPTQALAAWSIGMRIEALVFMPLMALAMAVASIIGQNLGARQVKRAYKAAWHVTGIGIAFMAASAVALFFYAPYLARIMSLDARTVEYTVSYIRINAAAGPALAIAMILSGALQGAGDTRPPMWISIFSNWVIRVPLCWVLALTFAFGPAGAWWAMASSIAIMALLITWRFQSKAWVRIRV